MRAPRTRATFEARLTLVLQAAAALAVEGLTPTNRLIADRLGWKFPACVQAYRKAGRRRGIWPWQDAQIGSAGWRNFQYGKGSPFRKRAS
jgi:hypothetical protein